jgi:hypothetical protein
MSWRDSNYGSESNSMNSPDSPNSRDSGVSYQPETSQATEALALHAALPVRYLYHLPTRDRPAVLNCGHEVEVSVRSSLMQGTSVRCVACYLEKMQNARRMLDR